MMFRNRSLIFGVAFLFPLFMLMAWFVSAPPIRCNLYQNLGYAHLMKGTQAPARSKLVAAERWFVSPSLANCQDSSVSFGLAQSYSRLGRPLPAIYALKAGDERVGLRRFLIANLYEQMGREEDAWREYRELPLDAAAHFYKLGIRAEKAGYSRKALHYYSISVTINPAAFKSYYAAGFVYWRQLGDERRAAQMIRQGLATDPTSSAQREFSRGLLCYFEGKTNCAVAAWVSAAQSTSTTGEGPDPRYLAYEMLGRALVADRAVAVRRSAAAIPGAAVLGHGPQGVLRSHRLSLALTA